MGKEITSESLLDYIRNRLSDPAYGLNVSVHKKSVILARLGRSVSITPYINGSKVEVLAESSPPIEGDFSKFIEDAINGDRIFMRGGRLYSSQREEMLPIWQKTFKRIIEKGDLEKLSCKVIDRQISAPKLQNYLYEYMVRPLLSYCTPS